MSTTRWLNENEQGAWRAWLEVMRLLPNHLEDRLHERHDLTLTDYQVLVEVSESAEHRLRMTELSHRTQLSKSRLSHQIGRMERAGLVVRTQCPDDRRGQWAELTEQGWTVLREAAPGHVSDVRELFFDILDEQQVAALAAGLRAVADKIGMNPATGCANARAEMVERNGAEGACPDSANPDGD
ncbi:MarR family winged helix-turn-helix transcriptional regulator [Actinospica sp.]|jgi:DNA-binding MarR family transcriptional regulator|uniref:MarR family winged helix-turn-helix transcriptional regulator n=1 Tax=Actinospica sp. TaxID=1872142 RepID=UPI002BC182FF|nr:MarR family winged helix-turn-helix transcriptional regulator [Actinospica sp.]HWG26574.1 MarR family winged helix-turn-helix transcriptional regulator [Actinospica sp.]